MPKLLTEKEVRLKFLQHLKMTAEYWAGLEGKTPLEKVEGAIFSVLVALDGESAELPAFIVAPNPHESDKSFYKDRGENWFPENHDSKIICNISGSLHDTFRKIK
jgi:hypothetical protein